MTHLPYNTGKVRIGQDWRSNARPEMDDDACTLQAALVGCTARRDARIEVMVCWACATLLVALGVAGWRGWI